MQQILIGENEAGQRMDKFLMKFMPLAPASFFYKMLRKKNITLNGKKAEGKEKLASGDKISFYLADETISCFQKQQCRVKEYEEAYTQLKGIEVVYEDEYIVILNKPEGILSQKADKEDLSLNEWMIGYLLSCGSLSAEQLSTYKPSVCNRLDRNTEGLVIGAKSLAGSQEMNRLISQRQIRKFYRMLVKGRVEKEETLEGFLVKEEKNNTVHLVKDGEGQKGSFIKTRYYPVAYYPDRTLVEAELITGRSHQIRIHMASTDHPLLGDYKYGDRKWNDGYKRRYGICSQLLYACRLEFPEMKTPFEKLDRKVIEIPYPVQFQELL
ncbi:RluA family pseudouridine synthase [Lachnospiraceae bacterium 64-25]